VSVVRPLNADFNPLAWMRQAHSILLIKSRDPDLVFDLKDEIGMRVVRFGGFDFAVIDTRGKVRRGILAQDVPLATQIPIPVSSTTISKPVLATSKLPSGVGVT